MKSKINIFLIGYSLLIWTFQVYAQQTNDSIPKNRIFVKSKPTDKNTIKIRWAPSDYQSWTKLNQYGYKLTRTTITRDLKVLQKQEVIELGVFKPKSLEEWKDFVLNNNDAAIMAQALYGENFDVSGQDQLSAIVSMSEQQQQRFTWGLFAADQNFKVAVYAGLGFIDNSVKTNEKYIYQVESLVPNDILIIKEGKSLSGLAYYEKLPKPKRLFANFLDKRVILSWNASTYEKLYITYFVERSEDGKKFTPLNNRPLMQLNKNKDKAGRIFFMDTIINNKTYYYRIRGKTIFEELSPYSNVVSGKAKPTLKYFPNIYSYELIENEKTLIKWKFPKEGTSMITHFELNRSDKENGNYAVVEKNIPPDQREILFDDLHASNYFTITAFGKNGGKNVSLPVFVQPIDSIPPEKPTGLTGTIDSLGIVTLKWNNNKEKDMLGYRVFRGNNKNEEFSQITVSPHKANVYYDSIDVHNLNKYIYYQVVAVDKRYNMSEYSDIVQIKKPDYIPPVPPLFKSYEIKGETVIIEWINSTSNDVVKQQLLRKEENSNWKIIFETKKINSVYDSFIDNDVKEGKTYQYKLTVFDDSNLQSINPKILQITIPKIKIKPKIKAFEAEVDRKNKAITLYWRKYKYDNIAYFRIYKAKQDKKLSLMREVLPGTKSLIDKHIKPGNRYKYMIQAFFKDGTFSQPNQIIVKY
jgi:fibronectin type 3 domain-containing protein